jgi:hypothetical protein
MRQRCLPATAGARQGEPWAVLALQRALSQLPINMRIT